MTLKVVIHPAEEGGYWAEVPALPGCFTEGESLEELRANVIEAIEAYLGVGATPNVPDGAVVMEIAV